MPYDGSVEQDRTQSALPAAPLISAPAATSNVPPHTKNENTLSPTSEFMRYVLAALPSRYTLRGLSKTIFDASGDDIKGIRGTLIRALRVPGAAIERLLFGHGARDSATIKTNLEGLEAGSYGLSLGLGSMLLTRSYSRTVHDDIQNLFCETVGDELGKPHADVTFNDIQRSDNKIIQRTLENFRSKTLHRYLTDLLFLPAALMRKEGLVDFALGVKGVQLFADTWKRKTTMFEDLITFVNNKINPRNGLGQPINQGELFDLYQHYTETFQPDRMFTNVVERGTGEGAHWATSQPIFQRMTDLMNQTYAYKHRAVIDPKTGHAVHQADFALPKFIYLLGHDLIDINKPEQTLATIEIANRYGMQAVKDVTTQLSHGVPLAQATTHYPYPAPTPAEQPTTSEKNAVIHKGSTRQLDAAPVTKIDAETVKHIAPLALPAHAIA